MYASINNIKTKSDEELKELRDLRINELWIGVETADSDALDYLNKGFNIEESRTQLNRLGDAGINFFYGFMYGAAGKGRGIATAEKNAALINETKPIGIAPTTVSPNAGTVLFDDVESGQFQLAPEGEIFDEMKKTIELVDVDNLIYYGRHVINTIPFDCLLPRDKKAAIAHIDQKISDFGDDYLTTTPSRHTI